MTRNQVFALVLTAALLAGCGAGKARESKATGSPAPSAQSQKPAPSPAQPPAPPPGPSDMYFQGTGDNPVINPERQPVSTFGVDVDTASYTLVRNYLERGTLPPADAVRAEEFINYFPQLYPAPADEAVTVRLEAGPNPFRPAMQLVQVGLKAREVDRRERKPAVLTFVIDVSGSMNLENRLGLVKKSLGLLVDQLDSGDRVGIVIYGSRGQVLLEHTSDRDQIRRAIARLEPGGSTNAEEGLTLGYDLAYRAFREGAANRVILCTDGVANVGATGPDAILRKIDEYRSRGINLTTVGFGMGNYNDVLLEQLADKGDGRYAYVDSLDEAQRVFVAELTGTLQVMAKDVKVQVRFDPEQVASYRLVGYENRTLRNDQFRDDRADAGEMGAGDEVTALYEVQLRRGASRDLGSVSIRYQDVTAGRVRERQVPIARELISRTAEEASARLRWTAAVAEFAGILKGSPWAVESTLSQVSAVAGQAGRELDATPEQREFLGLVDQARRLKGDR